MDMAGKSHYPRAGSGPDVSNRPDGIHFDRIQVDQDQIHARPGPLHNCSPRPCHLDFDAKMAGNTQDLRSEVQVGDGNEESLGSLRFHQPARRTVW